MPAAISSFGLGGLLNVVMIASVCLLLRPWPKPRGAKFLVGHRIVLAGLAQALSSSPLAREGYSYHWIRPGTIPTVREVLRKMLAGSIGVAAFQINVLVTQSFASGSAIAFVANFNYAVRLMELPQGMFGIPCDLSAPDTLGLAGEKKFPEFRQTLSQGLATFLANLIAAAIAFSLATPIVR